MQFSSESHINFETSDLCWVITEGAIGVENQALGLAEAIGLPTVVKRVTARAPWKSLPAQVWPRPLTLIGTDSDPVGAPWPRVLITCGRRSVPFSKAIKKASSGHCFTVHIQNPKVGLHNFDLVVPPRHDGLSGPNVINTRGAVNRVTSAKLTEGARRFAPCFAHLPRPLTAVLLGGASNSYKLTETLTAKIAEQLLQLIEIAGTGLAITPSRRTGHRNVEVLRRKLNRDDVFIWNGSGMNPYFGLLGLADAIVVTEDSINMVSEAASTGRPVYTIELEGGSRRFRLFHDMLRSDGITRPFDGHLEDWSYTPLDDTVTVAAKVRLRLGLAQQEPTGCP